MGRDRNATRATILAATEQIIARDGVGAARINAISATAGVDKVLIYRYFGGRIQLLRALARERRFLPALVTEAEQTGAQIQISLAREITTTLIEWARALRAQPLARRVAIWALTEKDELAREYQFARDETIRALIAELRARHQVPRYIDLEALITLLVGAMTHIALGSALPVAGGGPSAAVESGSSDDWRRIERVLAALVNSFLAIEGD